MSFDARSRERLEALGRTLPQKLPLPLTPASPPPSGRKADTAPRHRLETEENPDALFRALVEASADGSVPPHLLERLRELETTQPGNRPGAGAVLNSTPGTRPTRNRAISPPPRRASGPERDLYDAFDDLLHLERDDDIPDAPPHSERAIDGRLLPKPTLRQARPGFDRP
jgi:hypothetical protein